MKRLMFLFLIIACCHNLSAQKTKRFDVFRNMKTHLYGIVSYDGDIQTDTFYIITGRDARYQHIIEYIILREGGLKEIHEFFTYCLSFVKKEDDGVSDIYQGTGIGVHKSLGMKFLSIDDKAGGQGFTSFAIPDINQVLAGIEYFAKKHHKNLN